MKKKRKEKNSSLPFFKIEATGNDFIFIDQRARRDRKIAAGGRSALVKKICDRHRNIGSDGVVFIENSRTKGVDVKWDFYNSDGSSADMCGNAARAMANFVFDIEGKFGRKYLQTNVGIVAIRKISEKNYGAVLPPVKFLKGPSIQKSRGKSILYFLVNSGVPHAVIPLKKKLDQEILKDIAVELKRTANLGRGGANVTFVWKNKSGIGAITHERGVEDFTLSCGTGTLAAAWVAKFILEFKSSERVEMPGGELKINFAEEPELIGSATLIAKGILYV